MKNPESSQNQELDAKQALCAKPSCKCPVFWRHAVCLTPLLVACAFCLALRACHNNPWPDSLADSNTLFLPFRTEIKSLDPAVSYFQHENQILSNIVEAPLAFHYLHRPYQLVPRLLEKMPIAHYFDRTGQELPGDPPADRVAHVEYECVLKKGILWQPHPCFAPVQPVLTKASSPMDIPTQGTRELCSEDFRLTLVRLCAPTVSKHGGTLQAMLQAPMAAIRIEDSHRFRLILSRKYPQALYWMAMHFLSPTPQEALAFYESEAAKQQGFSLNHWPVGTGPFLLKTFQNNASIVLERNPNHQQDCYPQEGQPDDRQAGRLQDAGRPLPFLDQVIFLYEKEALPGWIKFTQGYYDLTSTSDIPTEELDSALALNAAGELGLSAELAAHQISLMRSSSAISYYYGFNMLDPIFGGYSLQQKKLRQAISIAIDVREFIELFQNGRGTPMHCILPENIRGGEITPGHYNRFVFQPSENGFTRLDLDYAKQLLAEAGYPGGIGKDGHPLSLHYDNASAGSAAFKAQFQWLKARLAALGIELEDNGTDLNRFRDKMAHGNWQFARKGWVADYPDAENFLMLFHSTNGHVATGGRGANYFNYANPAFDTVFVQLESMADSSPRDQLIHQATNILMEDAPAVWDLNPLRFSLAHHWVHNYKPHEMDDGALKYLRIDPTLRSTSRRVWNRPCLWPIRLVLLILGLMGSTFIYRHRHQ